MSKEHKNRNPDLGAEIAASKEAKGKQEKLGEVVQRLKKDISIKAAEAIKKGRGVFDTLSKRALKVDAPTVSDAAQKTEINYVDLIREYQTASATAADLERIGPPSKEAQAHLPKNFDEKYQWLLRHSNGDEWTYKAWIVALEKFSDASAEDRAKEIAMTPELKDFLDWPSEKIGLLLKAIKYEVRPSFDDIGGEISDEEIEAKAIELTLITKLPHTYDYKRYAIGGEKPKQLNEKFPGWGRKDFGRLCDKLEEMRKKGIEEVNRK